MSLEQLLILLAIPAFFGALDVICTLIERHQQMRSWRDESDGR